MKLKRMEWLASFGQKNNLTPSSLLYFHKNAGAGDKNVGLQIDRGPIKTQSITQIIKNREELSMRYESLRDKKASKVFFGAVVIS